MVPHKKGMPCKERSMSRENQDLFNCFEHFGSVQILIDGHKLGFLLFLLIDSLFTGM